MSNTTVRVLNLIFCKKYLPNRVVSYKTSYSEIVYYYINHSVLIRSIITDPNRKNILF